jgi:hypothetical protein
MIEAIPNMRNYYDRRVKELYAENNPYVIYGSIFVEYILAQTPQLEAIDRSIAEENLTRAFALLEELSASDDFETRCLAETGTLESLIGESKGLGRFEAFMGPETVKLARAVAANMGIK